MIYDVLEVFSKDYEQKGDKLILDTYHLKDGLYIKINNSNFEYFLKSSKKIKKDDKNATEHYFKDSENSIKNSEYEWFKERDYYSNVIDTAKSYDAPKKSIHNNNYLTLFMKIEEFLTLDFSHIETKLYKKVFSFKDFNSKNEKKILENFCPIIKSFERKKDIVNKMRFMKKNLLTFKEIAKNYNPKEYIRIFFDKSQDLYKSESSIYLALKIYNKNEYSIDVENVIYGLSNDNMGLNSKKPFLENKTKKLTTPFMITPTIAMQSKFFFDWLALQPYNKTDVLQNIFLNKYSDNGKSVINDFDYLPITIEKLDTPIKIKNYLQIKDKEDYEIVELSKLEAIINEIIYNKQLTNNYFGEVYRKLNNSFANLIYITRDAMINYFKKYDEREFYQIIKKYGSHFVIEHLRQNREYKAKESLNLKFSLLNHKGEKIMDIKSMQERMIQKLETSDYTNLNSEEFFYLCGQVASYLLSNKNQLKMHDLVEPFLRANNAQKLKKEVEFVFFQYKHAIHFGAKKINNAIALIEAYEGKEKLSYFMDSFLVGYLSNTYIFKLKEEK